jgi:rhodanese-related sulfurtransferase
MRTLLLACCMVVGLAAADHGAFPDISHEDLVAAISAKTVTVIDVNGSESFAKTHVDGAIDFTAVKAELATKLPADKGALVVAYCGSPQCTAWKQAAEAVAALGYTNVKHYKEGLKGWTEKSKAN